MAAAVTAARRGGGSLTGAARGIGRRLPYRPLAADGWFGPRSRPGRGTIRPVPYPLGQRGLTWRGRGRRGGQAGRRLRISSRVHEAGRQGPWQRSRPRWPTRRPGGGGAWTAAVGLRGRVIAGGLRQWEVPPEQERAVLDIDLGGGAEPRTGQAVPALLRRARAAQVAGSSRSHRAAASRGPADAGGPTGAAKAGVGPA